MLRKAFAATKKKDFVLAQAGHVILVRAISHAGLSVARPNYPNKPIDYGMVW